MPRLFIDNTYDFFNAATVLNSGNAGFATGTSTSMTIRNDSYSLQVAGNGLLPCEQAGQFAGFGAGRITELEFRSLSSFNGGLVARFEGIDIAANGLSQAGLVNLLETTPWVVRPLSIGVSLDFSFGFTGDLTIWGSSGDDSLTGGGGSDRVYGGDGSDYLQFDMTNDSVYGGAGGDWIRNGGTQTATGLAYGGDGRDEISDVRLAYGGTGADQIWASTGRLYGGDSADEISTVTGRAYGGTGNDNLVGAANAQLYGGEGSDRIEGQVGTVAYGGGGDDRMTFEIDLTSSVVTQFYGGAGNDLFRPGANSFARDTPDLAEGGQGTDTLFGYWGADTLNGGDDNDLIYAGTDADRLLGGTGSDALYGGDGNDTLSGSDGADTLTGGAGNDELRGGGGSDLFIFHEGFGTDRIFDFSRSADRLQFAVAVNAETSNKGVRLTSPLDDSQVVLIGANLSDVDGIPNVFLV